MNAGLKDDSFSDAAKFIPLLNRLVYLKGGQEIAAELKTPVTGCYFACNIPGYYGFLTTMTTG